MRRFFLFWLVAIFPTLGLYAQVGQTSVAKWKDDKDGVFLLMFDDGWPGQVRVAVPELVERGLSATFYLNPAKGEYLALQTEWAAAATQPGIVFANHTMTHQGVENLEDARYEIGEAAQVIRTLQPGKPGRLVSFGKPGVGGGAWNITPEEQAALLNEYHLIDRPPFAGHGAVYHLQTLGQMTALIDQAISSQDMNYLVVHGVERLNSQYQDFWPLDQDIFLPLLDYMQEKSDAGELWVTDHISQYQYETEREQATVNLLEAGSGIIRLTLSGVEDPSLYDLPLTLLTSVPEAWDEVRITQGDLEWIVPVTDGVAMYDVIPDGTEITIIPAPEPGVSALLLGSLLLLSVGRLRRVFKALTNVNRY